MSTVDFLDEDIALPSGQKYALISVVSKSTSQKSDNDRVGLKIRGVFETKEEANSFVKRIMKFDASFDVFMCPLGKWLLLPPNSDDIDDQQYQEQYLNDMVKEYKQSQLEAKAHFQERKRKIMEQGLDSQLPPEERLPEPTESLPTPEGMPSLEVVVDDAAGPSN